MSSIYFVCFPIVCFFPLRHVGSFHPGIEPASCPLEGESYPLDHQEVLTVQYDMIYGIFPHCNNLHSISHRFILQVFKLNWQN